MKQRKRDGVDELNLLHNLSDYLHLLTKQFKRGKSNFTYDINNSIITSLVRNWGQKKDKEGDNPFFSMDGINAPEIPGFKISDVKRKDYYETTTWKKGFGMRTINRSFFPRNYNQNYILISKVRSGEAVEKYFDKQDARRTETTPLEVYRRVKEKFAHNFKDKVINRETMTGDKFDKFYWEPGKVPFKKYMKLNGHPKTDNVVLEVVKHYSSFATKEKSVSPSMPDFLIGTFILLKTKNTVHPFGHIPTYYIVYCNTYTNPDIDVRLVEGKPVYNRGSSIINKHFNFLTNLRLFGTVELIKFRHVYFYHFVRWTVGQLTGKQMEEGSRIYNTIFSSNNSVAKDLVKEAKKYMSVDEFKIQVLIWILIAYMLDLGINGFSQPKYKFMSYKVIIWNIVGFVWDEEDGVYNWGF